VDAKVGEGGREGEGDGGGGAAQLAQLLLL